METRPVPKAVHENIDTIAQVRDAHRHGVGRHQRAMEAVSGALGRPWTVYGLLIGAVLWILCNVLMPHLGHKPIDAPPFYWLQGATGLLDALIAATVLTAQSRQNREAEARAHLELQVNLVAEQKATKIIALLEELRRDIPSVRKRHDPEAEALQQAVDPKAVLSVIERTTTGRSHDSKEDPGK